MPDISRLFAPVSNSTLALTRIGFGAVMVWNFTLLLGTGLGAARYQDAALQFVYPGLEWLVRLAAPGMVVLLWIAAISAACMALGLFYRLAAPAFVLVFGYLQFHDPTVYSNFHYLSWLTAFWLAASPAHRVLSLDARIWPGIRSNVTPRWTLWILRFQISVAYFFGGVVKFNSDWLGGEPVREWLQTNAPDTVFGAGLAAEPVVMFFAYSGLLFDLTIALWLLLPRTRMAAVAACAGFHLMNEYVFEVGLLPFFMIVMILPFLPPAMFERLTRQEGAAEATEVGAGKQKLTVAVLVAWVAWQSLFPLRHLAYPGDGRWTHEGQRFSWWFRHASFASDIDMWVEEGGVRTKLNPPDYLAKNQYGIFIDPHLVVQFGHMIARRDYTGRDVAIYADVRASLNRRPWQQFIPPDVNLLDQPVGLSHYDWVVPLGEQLLGHDPTKSLPPG